MKLTIAFIAITAYLQAADASGNDGSCKGLNKNTCKKAANCSWTKLGGKNGFCKAKKGSGRCDNKQLHKFVDNFDMDKNDKIATVPTTLCHDRVPNQGWIDWNDYTCGADATPQGSEVCPAAGASMLEAAPCADVALFNSGTINTSLMNGNLKVREVYDAFYWQNNLVVTTLTGKQIKHVLEDSMAFTINWFDGKIDPSDGERNGSGGYPCASKLRWHVDVTNQYGSRFDKIEYYHEADGQWYDVTDDMEFDVVTNTYLAGGGDGYLAFEDAIDCGGHVDLGVTDTHSFLYYAYKSGKVTDGNKSTKKNSITSKEVCE